MEVSTERPASMAVAEQPLPSCKVISLIRSGGVVVKAAYRSLELLLADSDIVIPQLPLDASTEHLLNRERLARMKPGALIVNVSRAEVVDREALIEALRSGHLGGFALDSLYDEPGRPDDELLSFDNVVLTPHMAGSPRTNGLQDIADMIEGLASAFAGG